jgi:type VI secretion system protein
MALRLRIVSEHARRLGSRSTKVFGVHGGTIGRATDNEWTLPDPQRYLSGKHARVEFRAGAYFIVDASSNGTYLNGASAPLGKSNERELKDGDYLRLGEYEMLVSIDSGNDFPPDEGAIVAYDGVSDSSAVKKSVADDIGANLDLSELLEPSGEVSLVTGVFANDAYGQAVADAPDGTPWHMMTRPFKVERSAAAEARLAEPLAAPLNRARPSAFADADIESGLADFCRGAGVDTQSITPDTRAAALHLAGRLLREVAVGLLDVTQSRAEFRNRFRVSAPAAEADNRSNFFAHGVDEALQRLLTTSSVRGGSVDAIRDSFQELKSQQTAMIAAMHAAFEEFLSRLDPKELSERFERNAKRGVFGSQNKARYWDLYSELFNTLAQRPADGFPHLFVETFARAYEEKFTALAPVKRTAFGGEREEPSSTEDRAVGEF